MAGSPELELICEGRQVDDLMVLIEYTASTGQAEAGWIYVTDVVRVIPVGGMHE